MLQETIELPKRVIVDQYIIGTNLRLRQLESDGNIIYKLTKKSKLSADKAAITTIYLSLNEYELLSKMRSVVVSKIRFISPYDNLNIAIDVYAGEEDELWIADIEFNTDEEMNDFLMPFVFQTEVTGIDEFSGLNLANRFGFQNRRF
jgi:CYTH domain-containing protein